jgi:aspartate aminotransferase
MTRLADRTARISSSPTMKVTATVDRLRRQGVEIIDFGAGEPDFQTPAHISAAAHAAIDRDFTKYTPVAGITELRRAICDRYRVDYGVEYQESEVIVSAGGKQALFNTALTLFNPGDEVITHAPYWPTLSEQIKLAEATPVLVRTSPEEGFAIRSQAVLNAVTARATRRACSFPRTISRSSRRRLRAAASGSSSICVTRSSFTIGRRTTCPPCSRGTVAIALFSADRLQRRTR